MTVRRRAAAGSVALLVFIVFAMAAARAEQTYKVDGRDTYQIGEHDVRSEIAYTGTQALAIVKHKGGRRYIARVEYERNDQGTRAHAHGSFESTVAANGEQRDGANHDPDYLTVLNQPFAVQLDGPTLRDLARLRGAVPFDFPSPMTGAPLHGTLRHIGDAVINGEHVLGVAFDATGPLHGSLPDHPSMALSGQIRMSGSAYYTYSDALLLELDATLAIGGNVDDSSRRDPVTIIYKRSIKAIPSNPVREARLTSKPAK
ncbi:MAG: hypothetical protein NVS2B17_03150 [Candidatus Velthaea sp.]